MYRRIDLKPEIHDSPFDAEQYLILNLTISSTSSRQRMNDSIYPSRFLIDYVRVCPKQPWISHCSGSFFEALIAPINSPKAMPIKIAAYIRVRP